MVDDCEIDSSEESKSSLGSVQVGCGQNPLVGDGVARTRSQAGVWSMPMALRWARSACPSGQEHAEDGGSAVGRRGPAT